MQDPTMKLDYRISETLIFPQRLFQGGVVNPDSEPDATFFFLHEIWLHRISTVRYGTF